MSAIAFLIKRIVGWVETTVETQQTTDKCWVLLPRNPTYAPYYYSETV
jgi:hypothetical protein